MEPRTQPLESLAPNPVAAPSGVDSAIPTPVVSGHTAPASVAPGTVSLRPTIGFSASDTDVALSTLKPGANLDGYELLEQVGRGGMGVVFRARQPNSEQIVAVKVLRDSLFADSEANERFLHEVRAMGRLQSVKNIVPIYHVGQHQGCYFLVMPYLAGGNLSGQRKRFPLDPAEAVTLVEKMARAVHQLHQNQVLHRDIKPGNIMLDAAGEPFLSDLGLAKLLDQNQTLTASQQRLGTPAYMSPEQTGLVPLPTSPQTDIWALGVVLYELLVGQRPFVVPTDADVSTTLLWKIVNETPPRPRTVQPMLDAGLEAVILKCLEKQPADRYATAEELADELARWLRQEQLRTPPVSIRIKVRRFVRNHPRVTVGLALAAVLLLAVAAVAYDLRRRNSAEYTLASMRNEMQRNGTIVLVAEKGRPRWHGRGIAVNVNTDGAQDGYWVIESFETGLIELMRNVPFESYRVRAEIGHFKDARLGPEVGHVGIFVALQAKSSSPKESHFWCNLTFNDIASEERKPAPKPGDLPGNTARLRYRLFADTGAQMPVDDPFGWVKPIRFNIAGAKFQWRTLEIDVSPDSVIGRFDGQETDPMERAPVIRKFHEHLASVQQTHAARYGALGDVSQLNLDDRGSLGLVVTRSSVMVKNVSLTRLPKAK